MPARLAAHFLKILIISGTVLCVTPVETP